MTRRVGGLCAGYGGLEMGLAQVLDCEPAWFCEFADGPSKILAHRYPGVPNHHDLTATDWDAVEAVDIVTAGWPCQPWSVAGARKGADDERAIWPAIAGAIRTLRPRLVCLENVSAVVAAGELARAVGDLAAVGYDAQWVCVRASDVGAPHRRERIFILATDTAYVGHERRWDTRGRWTGPADSGGATADSERGGRERGWTLQLGGASGHVTGDGADAADSSRDGRHEGWPESAGIVGGPDAALSSAGVATDAARIEGRIGDGDDVRVGCGTVESDQAAGRSAATDTNSREHPGREQDTEWSEVERAATAGGGGVDWGEYAPAIQRWEHVTGRPAPAPTEPGPRGGQRLSPLLVEWMMGLPAGWVTDVPGLSRNEQLKALGNGVIPLQAATAFTHLLQIAQEAA